MKLSYFEDKIFVKKDFSHMPLERGEYESCKFINCDFSNTDLSETIFSQCVFESCNLSMASLIRTAFRETKFMNCKMLGLRFETCNKPGLSFTLDNCRLEHSSFYQIKLRNSLFKNTNFTETDFTEGDLSSSLFDNCNFIMATFENTVLEKCDFRTSFNYSIDPERNRIKKAKFSLAGLAGLLDKYDIDTSDK